MTAPGARRLGPLPPGRAAVVGVLFPGPHRASEIVGALGTDVDVRLIDWVDAPEVRQAKSDGSRSHSWLADHEPPLSDRQRADLAEADVLLALDLPVEVPSLAPRLRWVQGIGAGVGQLVEVLRTSGVRLCSAAGLGSATIAEFVMARLLGVWKGLRTLDGLQRGRRWDPVEAAGAPVAGRTVCIVGLGGIGSEVARRAAAFDLRLVGARRRPERGAPAHVERVVGPDDLHELLPGSDAVVVAAPATARTSGLIGRDELAAMPPGAVLCNVARGSLVDEVAVADALRSGHLGAAILDVTGREPLSRQSPLWSLPGAYLSPHVAGMWGPGYARRVGDLLAENLERDRRDMPLANEVDLDEGY